MINIDFKPKKHIPIICLLLVIIFLLRSCETIPADPTERAQLCLKKLEEKYQEKFVIVKSDNFGKPNWYLALYPVRDPNLQFKAGYGPNGNFVTWEWWDNYLEQYLETEAKKNLDSVSKQCFGMLVNEPYVIGKRSRIEIKFLTNRRLKEIPLIKNYSTYKDLLSDPNFIGTIPATCDMVLEKTITEKTITETCQTLSYFISEVRKAIGNTDFKVHYYREGIGDKWHSEDQIILKYETSDHSTSANDIEQDIRKQQPFLMEYKITGGERNIVDSDIGTRWGIACTELNSEQLPWASVELTSPRTISKVCIDLTFEGHSRDNQVINGEIGIKRVLLEFSNGKKEEVFLQCQNVDNYNNRHVVQEVDLSKPIATNSVKVTVEEVYASPAFCTKFNSICINDILFY